MRTILLFLAITLIPAFSYGQDSTESPIERNTVYFELGGQGLLTSVKYDRLFRVNKKHQSSFSVGLILFPWRGFNYGLPVSCNFLFGPKNSKLEVGIGITCLLVNYSTPFYSPNGMYNFIIPKIGYRFQKAAGGLFFNIAITPAIAWSESYSDGQSLKTEYFHPFREDYYLGSSLFGISLGYTLKR